MTLPTPLPYTVFFFSHRFRRIILRAVCNRQKSSHPRWGISFPLKVWVFGTENWLTLELETQANALVCAAPQIKSPSAGSSREAILSDLLCLPEEAWGLERRRNPSARPRRGPGSFLDRTRLSVAPGGSWVFPLSRSATQRLPRRHVGVQPGAYRLPGRQNLLRRVRKAERRKKNPREESESLGPRCTLVWFPRSSGRAEPGVVGGLGLVPPLPETPDFHPAPPNSAPLKTSPSSQAGLGGRQPPDSLVLFSDSPVLYG